MGWISTTATFILLDERRLEPEFPISGISRDATDGVMIADLPPEPGAPGAWRDYPPYGDQRCTNELSMSRRSPDANLRFIDDHETPAQVVVGDGIEQTRQSCFRVLDRGRPHPQANDASVGASRVHPCIGKVFIEGDDDGEIALRPLEDCVVSGAL